jgi:type I restriction enzyme S subunit
MKTPQGWRSVRLRYLCEINPAARRIAGPIAFAPMDAVGVLGGIRFEQTLEQTDVSSGLSYFEENDVIVAKITPCFENGKCALAENVPGGRALGSTEFHVIRPGPAVFPRFLFYTCVSIGFREPGEAQMYGAAGQKRVPTDFVKDFSLSFPGKPVQRAIVEFLDRETSQIDSLVARKQRMARLLDEKRQALISSAVTRGLDPSVPMKDSGVPWLGRVPAHWDVVPLKYLADVQSGITVGKRYDADQALVARPYLRVANVQDGYLDLESISSIEVPLRDVEQYELRPGDVVVTEGGDFDKLARGYVWRGEIAGCLHQNHIFAVRPHQNRLRSPFLSALMASLYGRNYFTATSVQSTNLACTNQSKLGCFPIALPQLDEQDSICRALEQADTQFQKATQQLHSTIDRLREYRSALITAVVTGQLDLREHERKTEALT